MPSLIRRIAGLTGPRIGLLLTAVSLLVYAAGMPFFELMELKAFDLQMTARSQAPPGDEVVIAAIDEKSLDALGRWPWPRTTLARLVDGLTERGARVIAFDMVFSEPDESSGMSAIKGLRQRLSRDPALDAMEKEADNDSRFASAVEKSGRVALGYFFHTSDAQAKGPDAGSGAFIERSRITVVRKSGDGEPLLDVPAGVVVEGSIDAIAGASGNFGHFNIIPDMDGAVRSAALVFAYNGGLYPHLSIEAVRMRMGSPPLVLDADEYGITSIRIGDATVPTDPKGRLLINYRGADRTFARWSASDIIEGRVPNDAFRDKIVLVGATATGIYDMRVTPVGMLPGVEVHANVIDNILKGDFVQRSDWAAFFDVVAIVSMGMALSLVLARLGAFAQAALAMAVAISYIGLGGYMLGSLGIRINVVYPVVSILFVSTGVMVAQFMSEEKKRRELRDAFSMYLSPTLVNEIVKDPSRLKLGGEEKELTVLFSDIRGFSAISESLEPQTLVALMNGYMTPMTEAIQGHDGTVDKYIGDAIMAFWGAPIDQADHHGLACGAAVAMTERLPAIRAAWLERGVSGPEIGIGIATGRVTVGNMGSKARFDYTVMGDAVNLSSRLEGLTKEYGVGIIVSEGTYSLAARKGEFVFRELDLVRVKGKAVPTRIYELMGPEGGAASFSGFKETFEAGLLLYRQRDWQGARALFSKCLDMAPWDGPSGVFVSRIDAFLSSGPPEEGWDGVFTMETK